MPIDLIPISWLWAGGATLVIIFFLITVRSYRIVPPSEAHLVVTPRKRKVCASDEELRRNGGKSYYFYIPSWVPLIGRSVRIMDITIKELVIKNQETYEKDQARYLVNSSTKYRIDDVTKAAETFTTDKELRKQLEEIIQSAIRAITVRYNVTDVRANKKQMSEEVEKEIRDDLKEWGLKLVSFALVDFQDTKESKVISNISRRREVQIESETRMDNANRKKEARIKEAESDQAAQDREIERDEAIAKRQKTKEITVAKENKKVKKEEMEVKRVEEVEQKEIEKEESVIQAQAEKEQRLIEAKGQKEQRRINGEGYKEEQKLKGQGNAAKKREEATAKSEMIRKQGLAEAEVQTEKAKAYNQFTEQAIKALTAKDVVEKDKQIGIALAEALKEADLKFVNAGETNNLLELISSPQGGANLGSMLDSFEKTSDFQISELVNNFLATKDEEEISQLVEQTSSSNDS
jgi:flotillin